MLAITPRGFTGHEHVDTAGIVHMNGRIYDPELGRFLQADPFVEDSTTLNRYTYVHNNPLAYTDPSGYFGIKKILGTLARITQILVPKLAPLIELSFRIAQSVQLVRQAIENGGPNGALFAAFAAPSLLSTRYERGRHNSEHQPLQSVIDWLDGAVRAVAGAQRGHSFAAAGSGGVHSSPKPPNIAAELSRQAALTFSGSPVTDPKFANGAVTAAMSFSFGRIARSGVRGDGELEDRRFRSERSALRYTQRNVEQPEGLEDGGFIHKDGEFFRVSRILGIDQSVDLGPPPDDAVAAWHRHPDLGPGSEHFSFAVSVTPEGPGPFYHYRQGDVAYSYHNKTRFYLIAPGDSLRVINPTDITGVQNPNAQNFGDMFRFRW